MLVHSSRHIGRRDLRGLEILLKGGQIKRADDSTFLVRSQSGYSWYKVRWVGKSWSCGCPEHLNKKHICKHIDAIVLFLTLPQILMLNLDPESLVCPNCSSPLENVVRTGWQRNKSGLVQRYRCNNCGYRFNDRNGFSKLKSNPALIVVATDLYLRGLSTREIERHLLEVYGNNIDHATVYRWVSRYLQILAKVERKLVAAKKIRIGDKWHVDESKIKVGGRMAYAWSVLDNKTRYLLACQVSRTRGSNMAERVIRMAIKRFGKVPKKIVTDGLSSYIMPIRNLNNKSGKNGKHVVSVKHIAGKTFQDKVNNNMIERYNRTLRRRIRVADKFEHIQSAGSFVAGFGAYYNLLRPSLGLQNKTPANKANLRHSNRLGELLRKACRGKMQ